VPALAALAARVQVRTWVRVRVRPKLVFAANSRLCHTRAVVQPPPPPPPPPSPPPPPAPASPASRHGACLGAVQVAVAVAGVPLRQSLTVLCLRPAARPFPTRTAWWQTGVGMQR